jgi:acetoin:2,6-dichlorophenolindophenol oxidoreductase subunit alpha
MNDELLLHFYRIMTRIRAFERAAYELYTGGKLPGFLHLSIGQEAVSAGACAALRSDDSMASTHRGHGDTIAKGVSVEAAMAELFGRATGACHAKGGSMHIADFSQGILGANGIIAAGVPITVGAALSAKYRKTDQVALAFFGDGATGTGVLHEGMNMAMLWRLPMIFVRQNNRYAESTPMVEHTGIVDVVRWAAGYGMPAVRVDGNDVVEVYEQASKAVERARGGA